MRCGACQAENRPTAKFCEQCGAALQSACAACGARLTPGGRFCSECGAPQAAPPPERFASPHAYTPAHLAERILKDRGALAGERKQVTVLFADVSGFTSISERLDPEDVHGLINRAFELMLAEIHHYEGTVNQFLGDGLMALFGAPVAHENHARYAAHAALGVQRSLADHRAELQRARGIDFRVRLGLNTGLVVVGAIGDNLRMDYTAVGDTTNTAARMLQQADPGQIVAAEATARLIAPYFELRQLGTFTVKNRAQPVAAWELLSPRRGVSRLTARAARGLSPLVGRDDALATLERAWTLARAGRGQAAFVVGDAGMGKSRLLLEFRRRLGEGALWIQGECASFAQATPFLVVIDVLKRSFGIEDRDDEAQVVAKVERGLEAMCPDAPDIAPYLRFLLSVDPGDAAVTAMDPAQRRARITAALERFTAAGSRRRPIVLVVEDAHWIDGASEEYLKSFVESLPGMAVLLIVTYRPLSQPPFGDHTYYWRIALQPVDEADAARILRATLAVDDLPGDLAAVVTRKAEGNPFFLEEIGRTLAETGAVRVEDGRLVGGTATPLTVPDTVQDVIAARIDRLQTAQKRTVQTAAVIGREFALGLLRRVSDAHAQLEQSLVELKRIELIYEKVGQAEAEYVFRHALTQDVAYASLLQAERRRLHALIGAAIEEVYAGRLDDRREELVHHFALGEVWDRVVRHAREAAERAAALFVDARAVEFYERALDALGRLPETPETARLGIDVRLAMRAPLWRAGRLDPLFARFKEAETLASRHGETERLDTIFAFLVQYHWAKGEQERAIHYGERCLQIAEARDDLGLRVTAHYYLAHAGRALGRFPDGLRHAGAILDALAGRAETERFGLSGLPYPGACGLAAVCLAEMGDEQGALAMIARGERVVRATDHIYSTCALAAAHGYVLLLRGRHDEATAVLEPAIRMCRERKFAGQLMLAATPLALAYARAGRVEEALALARESIALQEQAGAFVNRSQMLGVLGEVQLRAGDVAGAEAAATTALDFAERHGERGWEGWVRRLLGEIALRRGDRDAAATSLDEAQEIAEELAMRPLLERCRRLLREAEAR